MLGDYQHISSKLTYQSNAFFQYAPHTKITPRKHRGRQRCPVMVKKPTVIITFSNNKTFAFVSIKLLSKGNKTLT